MTIVGVVGDVLFDPEHPDDQRVVYLAGAQSGSLSSRKILARVRGDVPSAIRRIATVIGSDASATSNSPASVLDVLRNSTRSLRAIVALLLAAGAVAVSLALTGVFGIVAYNAGRREREIGVRLALGATSKDVIQLFVHGILTLIAFATVIASVAWLTAAGLLPESVQADDVARWIAFAIACTVLGSTGLAVTVAAAWRPATAHPIRALRAD